MERHLGVGVRAGPADHADVGPEPGGGQGLVGSFAARTLGEVPARDRLPGMWETVTAQGQIDVQAAYDRDVGSVAQLPTYLLV
jgi:hypothetical protein